MNLASVLEEEGNLSIYSGCYVRRNKMPAIIKKQCRILITFANNTGLFVYIFGFVCCSCCFIFSPLALPSSMNCSSNHMLTRHIKWCFPLIPQGNAMDYGFIYWYFKVYFTVKCNLKIKSLLVIQWLINCWIIYKWQ